MVPADPVYLIGLVPGVAAAVLSIYNFITLRRGASIRVVPPSRMGVWNMSRGADEKLLYIPLVLVNSGSRPGVIHDVSVKIGGGDVPVVRRVEFTGGRGTGYSQQDFREIVPPLPLSVPAGASEIALLECEDNAQVLQFDNVQGCVISVEYDDSSASVSFPLLIRYKDFRDASVIKFLDPRH